MCTVTYIPKGNNEFILTSNRDENRSRAVTPVETIIIGKEKILCPVDPVSRGSWIAVAASNRVACVLNGAFEKHTHQPPYTRSRGLVLLDYFRWEKFEGFSSHYSFEGIEPFTMVAGEPKALIHFTWDGHSGHTSNLPADKPHIWCSATLYDKSARGIRERWFRDWLLQNPSPNLEDQLHFHQYGGEKDDYNGLVMNRNDRVQTLSITAVDKRSLYAGILHQDLFHNRLIEGRIDFSTNEIMESH